MELSEEENQHFWAYLLLKFRTTAEVLPLMGQFHLLNSSPSSFHKLLEKIFYLAGPWIISYIKKLFNGLACKEILIHYLKEIWLKSMKAAQIFLGAKRPELHWLVASMPTKIFYCLMIHFLLWMLWLPTNWLRISKTYKA